MLISMKKHFIYGLNISTLPSFTIRESVLLVLNVIGLPYQAIHWSMA
nr:hypothetical protein [Brevibacillus laterosporus]